MASNLENDSSSSLSEPARPSEPPSQRDLVIPAGLLARCLSAWTNHHAWLDDRDDDSELHLWHSPHDTDEVLRHLKSWVNTRSQWDWVDADVANSMIHRVRLTHRTTWLRFVDEVTVWVRDNDNGTMIEAESRSRIGKGDLGQNRRNLRDLRNGFVDSRI